MSLLPTPELVIDAFKSLCVSRLVVSSDLKLLHYETTLAGDLDYGNDHCFKIIHNRQAPCEECGVVTVLETGRPVFKQVTIRVNGRPVKMHRHILPLKKGNRIEAVALLDLDVSQCADVPMEMGEGNAFLKNLIMSSVDGVIAADMVGNIVIFNESAVEITGYSQDEALNHLNIRQIYPEGDARQVMKMLRSDDFGGKGKLKSYPVNLLGKDEALIPINLSASIVYDCGHEIATVGFFHDLRQTLKMERELQQTQVQLMQAEKMSSLGKLSAGVAHQLNNPLGGIVLFSRLILEDYQLEEGARQDMQRIIDAAERCQHIVKELLDFARQSNLDFRACSLNQAIARTIFLLQNQPTFKQIQIIEDYDPSLPLVSCDVQQLNHVFMNLVINAADAMDGQGELRIKTRKSADEKRVTVEIADNGSGIPGDVLPHIFEPFFTTKEQGKGTGLGLSVAYGVIENHGGRLTACSAHGEGATFLIELPINEDPEGGECETIG